MLHAPEELLRPNVAIMRSTWRARPTPIAYIQKTRGVHRRSILHCEAIREILFYFVFQLAYALGINPNGFLSM